MKDYVKINKAIDKRGVELFHKLVSDMRAKGTYPNVVDYPITLQFEVTGQCNLACKHCYNRSGDFDRKSEQYTLMTPDRWCHLAHQIVKDGGIFQCIISGGEPLLLGDRLFDIMDILHNDGTSFVVITNGFLLTPEKVKKFKKYRFYWFQISIDGCSAEIHDSFRGVKGSWERAVRGAVEISANGIPLVIAHSVTPDSLDTLEEMVELACQLGASQILLGEILPSGRAFENKNIVFTLEQKNIFFAKVEELQKKFLGRIEIKRSAGLKSQLEHYMADTNMGGIIRPNGDFRLDCMAPFVIGNVLKKTLKQIWLEKGINAWKSPKVLEYITSIDDNLQTGNLRNHIDKDIYL